jgi:hypothetical protein
MLWDGKSVHNRTKSSGVEVVTDPNIGIVGAITPTELHAELSEVAKSNGFANRFLYGWSDSDKLLAFGGSLDDGDLNEVAKQMRAAIRRSLGTEHRTLSTRSLGPYDPKYRTTYNLTDDARDWWEAHYPGLRQPSGIEMERALLQRGAPYVIRLGMLFAVLDGAKAIGAEHLAAGNAWWDYSAQTVRFVFGHEVTGVAAKVLGELRRVAPKALNRKELHNAMGRHVRARDLSQAVTQLSERKLVAVWEGESSGGRPPTLHAAISLDGDLVRSFAPPAPLPRVQTGQGNGEGCEVSEQSSSRSEPLISTSPTTTRPPLANERTKSPGEANGAVEADSETPVRPRCEHCGKHNVAPTQHGRVWQSCGKRATTRSKRSTTTTTH